MKCYSKGTAHAWWRIHRTLLYSRHHVPRATADPMLNDYAFNYHGEDCWCAQQQFRQIWISALRGERSVLDESSRERDWQHKLEHKEYVDNKGGATDSSLAPGDKVLLRNTKASRKLTPNFESTPHTVLTNVNHVPNMADGRVFSAISHFDIPSSKKLHRTKSASSLSMVTDDSSSLAFNSPICDNRASISLKMSSLLSVKARAKLSSSYERGVEQQHQVPIKINWQGSWIHD